MSTAPTPGSARSFGTIAFLNATGARLKWPSAATIVALLAALLVTTAVAGAQLNDGGDTGVLIVTDAAGNTQPLDGATIAGPVYISLDPRVDASEVRFYIGPERQDPYYQGADLSAPFNLVENDLGVAEPFDATSLGAGEQLFWVTYNDGGFWRNVRHVVNVVEVSAESTERTAPSEAPVSAGGQSAGEGVLLVTDASGATSSLDGATVSGQVAVFLDPAVSASAVRFYLGTERNRFTFVGPDYQAPFTFADASGAALDVSALAPGDYVMWATYNQDGAWRHVAHAFRAVGGVVSDPQPPVPTPTATPMPQPDRVTSAPSSERPAAAPPVAPTPTASPVPFTLNLPPDGPGVLLATDSSGRTVRLEGASLSGDVRVWLDPRVNALEVRFYVGDQRRSENLRSIDYSAPFNLAEVRGRSVSLSAETLEGVVFATYNDNGVWRHVRHDFTVTGSGNGAAVAPPPPEPTSLPTPTPTAIPIPTATPQPTTGSTPAPPVGGGSNGPSLDPAAEVLPGDIVVAPGAAGAGTVGDPASLRTTLASTSTAPGTTVWLRGGTYAGEFESRSDGTAASPIVFRSYPGENAVIDGDMAYSSTPTLSIEGDWQTWTDLEFTNSNTTRSLGTPGSVGRPTLLHILGRGTAIINNSIHDGGVCVGWWKTAYDSEIYGNLIYNCGWEGPDRAHGHALYIQNLDNGRKLLEQNLVSSTYGRSLLIYGSDQVHNIDVYGNVFAGGASLGQEAKSPVYLSGAVEDLNFVGNQIYTLQKEAVSFVDGGETMRFDNNYLMTTSNSLAAIWVRNSRYVNGSGNNIASDSVQIRVEAAGGFAQWDNNTYYGPDRYNPGDDLADWQNRTGLDANSTNRSDLPTRVVVAANRYDNDRGLVTIWNGSRASSVAVDVSGVLEVGDSYVVLGGEDLGGTPVMSGTYAGGSLSFPMTQRSVGAPIGGSRPPGWGSEFGAFAILPGS